MARPHIQVILADNAIPASLQSALQRTAATAGFWPLSEALRANAALHADAVVVVVPNDIGDLEGPLRILFDRLAEHPRATLVLTAHGRAVGPLNHPATLPVTLFSGQDEHDLAGRLTAMLEMRPSLDSLHQGLVANRRSGESIATQYVNQLRLASQVQREFLPDALPRLGDVSFDVLFRPVDYVSGDIYDVRRLDEEHVGIAIADATGHGIPAALLTVYIKRALRGKEIVNGAYRILSPDEVLGRLNDDIMDAHLTECQFVAAVYAVLNTRTYELTLARGGAPYPIYRTAAGDLDVMGPDGGLVGVMPDAQFAVQRLQMHPGDSLLMYTDGLERIVAPEGSACQVPEGLKRAAGRVGDRCARAALQVAAGPEWESETATAVASLPDDIAVAASSGNGVSTRLGASSARLAESAHNAVTDSAWCAILERDGPTAALECVSGRQQALRRLGYPLDDLTVLCLQIDGL